MADTIAVMNRGRIEQLGSPTELYERPRTAFVAGFLGVSNLLDGTVTTDGAVRLDGAGEVRVGAEPRRRAGTRVADRRPAGEDPARTRAGANALTGTIDETRLHRRRDAVHRRHRRRHAHRLRPEHRPARCGRGRHRSPLSWEPGQHVRRRPEEAQHEPSRSPESSCCARGAAAARLCPPRLPRRLRRRRRRGRAARRAGGKKQLANTLRFSNWPLYIDIDEKTKKHPTLDAVHAEDGRQGRLLRGHQRQRVVLREDPGPALAGPVDRPRHHRPHRQLALPGPADRQGLGREARQERDPEHRRTSRTRSSTRASTRTASTRLPWQSGMTGIATNTKLTGGKPVTTDRPAARGPEAEGQGHAAHRDGRHDRRSSMLANGDDPTKVDRRVVRHARSTRIQKAVDSGQIRQFTGNDYSGPLAKGDLAAAMSLVGRRRPAVGRQPEPAVWNLPGVGRRRSGRTTC